MKTGISLLHNQARRILHSKLMLAVLLVFIFLGLSVSPGTALDNDTDQVGQPEGGWLISEQVEDQILPKVAYASYLDQYLVVWEMIYRSDDHDIYGILLDSQGYPIGIEIPITASGAMEVNPAAVYNPVLNEYFVVWEYEYSTSDHDLYATRIDANTGNILQNGIPVATSGFYDMKPVVTYDLYTQLYLVGYERRIGSDEFHQQDLIGQLITEGGQLFGPEISIANSLLDEQNVAVACDGINFLAVWQGDIDNPIETNIYGQMISFDGSLFGGQIGIATWLNNQQVPRVTYDNDDGQYLVVWEDQHFYPSEIYGSAIGYER